MRSSIFRLHTDTEDAWCNAMVYAIGCQFNSPDAHQLNQDDSSSRSESPWPVQGPTISYSQLNTEMKHRAHEGSRLRSELVTVVSLNIDIISRQTKYRRDRHVVYLGDA